MIAATQADWEKAQKDLQRLTQDRLNLEKQLGLVRLKIKQAKAVGKPYATSRKGRELWRYRAQLAHTLKTRGLSNKQIANILGRADDPRTPISKGRAQQLADTGQRIYNYLQSHPQTDK